MGLLLYSSADYNSLTINRPYELFIEDYNSLTINRPYELFIADYNYRR